VRRRRYENTCTTASIAILREGTTSGKRRNGKGKVLETRHAGNIPSSAVPFMDPGDDVAVALA
jgi:hypothetical protein